MIYDLASSSLVDTIKAHLATVWSLHVRPDEHALVSGSADKDIKFWEFESKAKDGGVSNDSPDVHSRTLIRTVLSRRLRVAKSCHLFI